MKVDDGQQRYTVVFTFEEVKERTQLYAILTGTLIGERDSVVAEIKLKSIVRSRYRCCRVKGLEGLKMAKY